MSGPLYRGATGIRISGNSNDLWDSQMKDKTEKEDLDRNRSSDQSYLALRFPFRVFFPDNNSPSKYGNGESGFASDPFIVGSPRSRHKLTLLLLKLSLALIVILALVGSFWWTISISTMSRGQIVHNYRRLREQLVSDLWDIGELSLGSSRLQEFEFCSEESENYAPCFNVSENLALGYSDGSENTRLCGQSSRQSCLVFPPVNYRIPPRWPTGRDIIWVANVKITAQEVLSSGSLTKRMMMLDEEQISFRSVSPMFDGVEDYSHQIAEMIGLRNESNFVQAGVRTILDIGCGYGSFGAHLFSKQLITMCIANYEPSGSQVQLTLERGLPAMIGSFNSNQLPYPSLSFDMLHCARCGIDWDLKDGYFLIEADRVLKPGGYFVWTSPLTNARNKENQKRWNFVQDFAENLCWEMLSQQDETVVWKKTSKRSCYSSRKPGAVPATCNKGHDVESPYYRPLQGCIAGTHSRRWIPIQEKTTWPSRSHLNKTELAIYGLHPEDFSEDAENWKTTVTNYWSVLSPIIFSDHPKRPGEEDPSPPYNMFRNVLDMNAHFGGFNAALLEAGKSVWVMNVVPTSGPNYLPLILDRGFVGVLHDWCEPFPTYPRSYDLVHAEGLLTLQTHQQRRCTMLDLFTEIDRVLRPEGWIIIRDTAPLVESARMLTTRLKWDARVIEIESNSDDRLLICQKPFFKRQGVSS
ncbi:SAM-DEPENDENT METHYLTRANSFERASE [Salix purpurea]|uniref:Methyltransferase n=2 Tax=Salix purpurea TaxID=77065 RepID=A0A9Q0PCS6_SALPP|nr:SAM-DEPENDENT METHYLTRANSFERASE [Salix purpurea]KAJ6685583.1 SAM-DEPENDENT METHYLTRANSFERASE [Salix purpurea]KAJ6685584.1 SAM-DEPENDENT METHYLTRANSFERASE [Salix purpurea]